MSGRHIKIVLCPGRFPEMKHQDIYHKIYQCWYDVWSATFLEIDKNPNLYSDAFTRQDVIAAIFVDDECVAVSLHRYTNEKQIKKQNDSYFANWSELHRKKLCSRGPDILVSSYFTIHPSARSQNLGFSTKDFLLALTTQVYLDSNCDAMTGAARKNRKVHDITYTWGATPVGIDVPSGHNDLVDLVAFFRPEVLQKREENSLTAEFNSLWEDRLVIAQEHPQSIEEFRHEIAPARTVGARILSLKKAA